MGCEKKFKEKIYFKIVVNTQTQQILNGNSYGLGTTPETQSFILTTKETGNKYLKEKPDTIVTYVVYRTIENPLVLESLEINNHQTIIKEKDSLVSYIGTETLSSGTQFPTKIEASSVVTGGSGRFEGATKATIIIKTKDEGNIRTVTHDITITGYRKKHHC